MTITSVTTTTTTTTCSRQEQPDKRCNHFQQQQQRQCSSSSSSRGQSQRQIHPPLKERVGGVQLALLVLLLLLSTTTTTTSFPQGRFIHNREMTTTATTTTSFSQQQQQQETEYNNNHHHDVTELRYAFLQEDCEQGDLASFVNVLTQSSSWTAIRPLSWFTTTTTTTTGNRNNATVATGAGAASPLCLASMGIRSIPQQQQEQQPTLSQSSSLSTTTTTTTTFPPLSPQEWISESNTFRLFQHIAQQNSGIVFFLWIQKDEIDNHNMNNNHHKNKPQSLLAIGSRKEQEEENNPYAMLTHCDQYDLDLHIVQQPSQQQDNDNNNNGILDVYIRTSETVFEPCQRLRIQNDAFKTTTTTTSSKNNKNKKNTRRMTHLAIVLMDGLQQVYVNGQLQVHGQSYAPFSNSLSHWSKDSYHHSHHHDNHHDNHHHDNHHHRLSLLSHPQFAPWSGTLYQLEIDTITTTITTSTTTTTTTTSTAPFIQEKLVQGLWPSQPRAISTSVYINEEAEHDPESHGPYWYNNHHHNHDPDDKNDKNKIKQSPSLFFLQNEADTIPLVVESIQQEAWALIQSLNLTENNNNNDHHHDNDNDDEVWTFYLYITRLPAVGSLYLPNGQALVGGGEEEEELGRRRGRGKGVLVETQKFKELVYIPPSNAHSSFISTTTTTTTKDGTIQEEEQQQQQEQQQQLAPFTSLEYCATLEPILHIRQCPYPATLTIYVRPVNDPPIPNSFHTKDPIVVYEGEYGVGTTRGRQRHVLPKIQLTGTDVDVGDVVDRVEITLQPKYGHVVLNVGTFRMDGLVHGTDLATLPKQQVVVDHYHHYPDGNDENDTDNNEWATAVAAAATSSSSSSSSSVYVQYQWDPYIKFHGSLHIMIRDSFSFRVADQWGRWSVQETVSIEIYSAVHIVGDSNQTIVVESYNDTSLSLSSSFLQPTTTPATTTTTTKKKKNRHRRHHETTKTKKEDNVIQDDNNTTAFTIAIELQDDSGYNRPLGVYLDDLPTLEQGRFWDTTTGQVISNGTLLSAPSHMDSPLLLSSSHVSLNLTFVPSKELCTTSMTQDLTLWFTAQAVAFDKQQQQRRQPQQQRTQSRQGRIKSVSERVVQHVHVHCLPAPLEWNIGGAAGAAAVSTQTPLVVLQSNPRESSLDPCSSSSSSSSSSSGGGQHKHVDPNSTTKQQQDQVMSMDASFNCSTTTSTTTRLVLNEITIQSQTPLSWMMMMMMDPVRIDISTQNGFITLNQVHWNKTQPLYGRRLESRGTISFVVTNAMDIPDILSFLQYHSPIVGHDTIDLVLYQGNKCPHNNNKNNKNHQTSENSSMNANNHTTTTTTMTMNGCHIVRQSIAIVVEMDQNRNDYETSLISGFFQWQILICLLGYPLLYLVLVQLEMWWWFMWNLLKDNDDNAMMMMTTRRRRRTMTRRRRTTTMTMMMMPCQTGSNMRPMMAAVCFTTRM